MRLSSFRNILKHLSFMTISLILIKLISVFKDSSIALYFGTARNLDIFFIGMIIPGFALNLISSCLSLGFVPYFQEKSEERGEYKSHSLFTVFFIVSFLLIIIISIFLFFIKDFAGTLFNLENQNEFFLFNKTYMYSMLIFITGTLSKLIQQLLFLKKRFFSASITDSFIPISIIIFLFMRNNPTTIYTLIDGFVFGYICQFIFLFCLILKNNYFKFNNIQNNILIVKKILYQSFFIFFGGSLSYLNFSIDTLMCSNLSSGSIAVLNYSNRIPAFFISFFTMSAGNLFVTYFSERFTKNKDRSFFYIKKLILYSLLTGLVIFILFYFFIPFIVKILYLRGAFSISDFQITINTVKAYSFQLIVFINSVLGTRILSILKKNHLLAFIGIFNFAANIFFNLIFFKYKTVGIALSTSIVYILSCIFLNLLLIREININAENRKKILEQNMEH